MEKCSQCDRAAIVKGNDLPLCVHCYHVLSVAHTLEVRLQALNLNHAAESMDFVSGMPRGFTPKMQVPDIPRGPTILNHIKLDNSVVGAINTGTVESIDVNISYLQNAGSKLPASPKGLRHAFGVHAVLSGVPLPLVQKWLGHADLSMTAIYTNVLGREEQEIAARMW